MQMSQETESHGEAHDNFDAEYGEIPHPCHNHCHFRPLTPNDDNLLTIDRLFYLEKKNGEMLLPGTSCLLLRQIRERSLEKCQPLSCLRPRWAGTEHSRVCLWLSLALKPTFSLLAPESKGHTPTSQARPLPPRLPVPACVSLRLRF